MARLFSTSWFTCFISLLQAQLFHQNFSSSNLLTDYISATPNNGQWNAIGSSDAVGYPVTITANALRFAKMGVGAGGFFRPTDFSPVPASVLYRFQLTVSNNTVATTSAGIVQLGSGFVNNNFFPQANTNVHSRFGINISATPGSFGVRAIADNINSSLFSGTQVITWAVNNSGATLSYRSPAGDEETIANDRWDLWVGTTRVFNDINALSPTNALTDLNFAYGDGIATMDFDNFLIHRILDIPFSLSATLLNTTRFTANWSTVTDNTGYNIDVATDAAFTNILPGYNNLYVSGASTSSLAITGLTPGATYFYRVRASANYPEDVFEGGNSPVQSVTLAALPFTLVDFTATMNNSNKAVLNWTTADELNTDHFTIQKSFGATHFDSIAMVRALNIPGTLQQYSFTDNDPVDENTFYRLKMVDMDARYTYSKVTRLNYSRSGIELKISPNPGASAFNVTASGGTINNIRIYDAKGRLIRELQPHDVNAVLIDCSKWNKGIYYLKITSHDTTLSRRFIKG